MKNTMRCLGWMLVWGASAAYAAQSGDAAGTGWLGYLFTGFFAAVIVMQLVPAVILFVGMLKGLFAAAEKTGARASAE